MTVSSEASSMNLRSAFGVLAGIVSSGVGRPYYQDFLGNASSTAGGGKGLASPQRQVGARARRKAAVGIGPIGSRGLHALIVISALSC
jgi:hypothetical protein